jgi:hypothetical protein
MRRTIEGKEYPIANDRWRFTMAGSSQTTTDHNTIRKWAEERGGRPATVKGTSDKGDHAGVLRFDFNEPEESLEEISWDDFFEKFDERDLALLFQDETSGGGESRFFKFVER